VSVHQESPLTYTETDLVATIERLAGVELDALSREQRDQFDQFHAGGTEAVDRVLRSLDLKPGRSVLDVGSGLGGPARHVATSSGCTVVGVDITRAYVDTAIALTRAAGLEGQVGFVCSDVAALDRDDFDAAYTMHVQMNVADKSAFFTEIGRRLRPGAPLATYEVCRTGAADPSPPLPWSLDGSDSFLATPDELCDTIAASGFEVREWVDETEWVIGWFAEVGARLAASAPSATLPALLNDGPTRLLNFAVALSTGVLSVHRGLFVAAP
jgi:SAM-dependent methyltransferase